MEGKVVWEKEKSACKTHSQRRTCLLTLGVLLTAVTLGTFVWFVTDFSI